MRPLACALSLLLAACAHAQLVPEGAQVERVATGMKFTEGPALGPDGAIYFSDIPNRKVHRFDPASGETTVFLEDSGGSNGLHWDAQGRLVLCADKSRKVTRRELDGEITVIEDEFEGKKLNSPNDLDLDAQGGIYFTDPSWAKRENRDMDEMGVYYISSYGPSTTPRSATATSDDTIDTPDGTFRVPVEQSPRTLGVRRLITDLKRPNGIAFSLDEKQLYVADNDGGVVYAYDLAAPGEVSNKREFAKPPAGTKGGPDGMTIDRVGNLYAAWHGDGAVHVWSPQGEHLARIELPKDGDKAVQPTNVEFAADGTTLYVTGGGSLYRVKLNVPEAP